MDRENKATGLSQQEADLRLQTEGYNEIPEKKRSPILKFLSYFWGPIPGMILAAVLLSGIARDWSDFAVISLLLFVNSTVGFYEEFQADSAIAALKAKLSIRARVYRDKEWKNIPARELVIGDLVRARIGDIVPADMQIIEGGEIEVDQSALTGESLPVLKKNGELLYSGSIIKRGEIDGIVEATGKKTYFGKTIELVETAHTVSHLQKALLKIGNYLIGIAIALVLLILAVSLARQQNLPQILKFVLVLMVAAIPTALPTILSLNLAAGANTLAKKQALVSRLSAIEELAGTDILCCDKTGTLTQNRISIASVFCINTFSEEEILLYASLASRLEDQDPIDQAIIEGVKNQSDRALYKILSFTPFDPVRKRTESSVQKQGGPNLKIAKGGVPVIIELCKTLPLSAKDKIDQTVREFASRGFRALGVAVSDDHDRWDCIGIIALYDPPREDSKKVIRETREMGVQIKMMTGDQIDIAKEIGKQLDLGTAFVSMAEQKGKPWGEEIEKIDGMAQVFPENKYDIVTELQKRGHIVGMTGDGVNDAPALKKADAGIAVANAVDAAKAAAAIVLMTPGLSIIIEAIKESRCIFQRMKSYATYRIAETIRILLFMTLSILFLNFYPVTAIMIVLIALLNDGAILTIVYDRVEYGRTPTIWKMDRMLTLSTILGITGVISSFGLFYFLETVFHISRPMIQTMMYLKLSVAGHFLIFITRTEGAFYRSRPAPILLWAVIGTQIIATFIAALGLFMPAIGWTWRAIIWGYAMIWLFITDFVKRATVKWILTSSLPK